MKRSWEMVPLLAVLVLASGCSVIDQSKITGGGTLNSAGGAQKAVVTVSGDTCGNVPKGRLTYDDRTAVDFEGVGGVSIRATVVKAGLCLGPPDPNNPEFLECNCPLSPALVADYVSTNPRAPGSGKAYACFLAYRDQTQLGSDQHAVYLQDLRLVGGPFDQYVNKGTMDGNIQIHACQAK
jgi:hypothetical protein